MAHLCSIRAVDSNTGTGTLSYQSARRKGKSSIRIDQQTHRQKEPAVSKPSIIQVEYQDKQRVIYKDVSKQTVLWTVYHTVIVLELFIIILLLID